VLSPCALLALSKRRFTVCVGTHTLSMFLKNLAVRPDKQGSTQQAFLLVGKTKVKGAISQMVTPLYHTRRGLSSQDMMKQHMRIRNISLTPAFQNEPASATCEAGHCQSLSCMGLCLCTLMYSYRPKTNLVVMYLILRSRISRAVMLRMATASVAGTTK